MGGSLNCHEPTKHNVLLFDQVCRLKFEARGWLDYFQKLTGYDETITF